MDKKLYFISARTTEAVKLALKAEAQRQRRTESEVLHVMVCQCLGLDPYDAESGGSGESDFDVETTPGAKAASGA